MALGPQFDGVLAAARTGAEWAWTTIYRDLAPAVLGYFRSHRAAESEDLTSEVFVAMVRNLPTFEGTEEQFRSWVFTIAHRRLLDERRHQMRHPVTPAEHETLDRPTIDDIESEAATADATRRVQATFAQLAPDQRDVLTLRVIADLSLDETARILGKTIGAVKSLQHRGLAAVARILAAKPVSP